MNIDPKADLIEEQAAVVALPVCWIRILYGFYVGVRGGRHLFLHLALWVSGNIPIFDDAISPNMEVRLPNMEVKGLLHARSVPTFYGTLNSIVCNDRCIIINLIVHWYDYMV